MKRITPKIKKLDLYASLINLLYLFIVTGFVVYLFSIMYVPDRPAWENPPTDYTYNIFFGMTLTQKSMNIMLSLFIGFLIVMIPMTYKSFQRYFDKKTIEVDEWSYRHQYLLGIFEIITLNPFSGAIRVYLGRHIQMYVTESGIIQGLINLWHSFIETLKTIAIVIKDVAVGFVRFIILFFKQIVRLIKAIYKGTIYLAKFIFIKVRLGFRVLLSLFINKDSHKYNQYLAAQDTDREALKTQREMRIQKRNERIELREKHKEELENKARTQEDLDETTRKDVVMQIIRLVLTYGTLTFTALFIVIPFYWMIITALKTYAESSLTSNPAFFISLSDMQWVNFKIALTEFNFLRYIGNTIFVGLSTMAFTVFTTILAAFAFSRLDFKGKDFIFSLLLMTMMIPGELYTITNYITVSRLGWIDSMYALIFPFSASVFYIFFLRQTFRQIPDTLYRAAKVDGSSDFKYLTRVMIPIAAPTIITIIILSSIGAWDAYIWPQLVSRTDATKLVSVALRNENFSVGTGSDQRPMYNLQLAATAIVTAPLLVVFFSLKKYILAGVGRSGTKG
ncbi:MAG: carbohydrate ABC transporter permease [Acholeplasmataceae bacterium]|nr:carbohydrate ABC transporter permease [Acholeplasmataceae bacterium]